MTARVITVAGIILIVISGFLTAIPLGFVLLGVSLLGFGLFYDFNR